MYELSNSGYFPRRRGKFSRGRRWRAVIISAATSRMKMVQTIGAQISNYSNNMSEMEVDTRGFWRIEIYGFF
jgi:hypothetical protein